MSSLTAIHFGGLPSCSSLRLYLQKYVDCCLFIAKKRQQGRIHMELDSNTQYTRRYIVFTTCRYCFVSTNVLVRACMVLAYTTVQNLLESWSTLKYKRSIFCYVMTNDQFTTGNLFSSTNMLIAGFYAAYEYIANWYDVLYLVKQFDEKCQLVNLAHIFV